MLSKMGLHRIAGFYAALFLVALVLGRVAGVASIFTSHVLTPGEVLTRVELGLSGGAVVALLSGAAARWVRFAQRMDALLGEAIGPLDRTEVLILAGLSGLCEEVLFRGALQAWLGLPAASFLFAMAHLPPRRELWPWTLMAAAVGVLLGFVTEATGDLVAAVVFHVVVNTVGLWRLAWMREVPK
jgi:membrane protease YdiL (CAAX protease family)